MTLLNFKRRIKIAVAILVMVVYGVGFFGLGRNSYKLSKRSEIKGAATTINVPAPLEEPQPYADQQKAEVVSSHVKTCSNATFAYEISYHQDWYTTYNNDSQICTFFAPYSFVVPALTDSDFVPIRITFVKSDDWENTANFIRIPNDFQNVISVQNLEINGRSVIRVESSSTGKGQIPRGYVKTSYLVFNNRTPLVISYQQLELRDDVLASQNVIGDMVESLKYF